jgi:hypothetical protein
MPSTRVLIAALSLAAVGANGADLSQDEAEALFDAPSAAQVNEGTLVFLSRLPEKPVHHHQNHIVIAEESLRDGWVTLDQCHADLDAVGRSQIVFSPGRTRELSVTAAEGVGEVWVEGNTVQLRDTARGARLCIRARSRALAPADDGSFVLKNGPYLRRFLDGYYPMRVSMRVTLDAPRLQLAATTPPSQPGFRIWTDANEVFFDAQFEGRLTTELRFHRRP